MKCRNKVSEETLVKKEIMKVINGNHTKKLFKCYSRGNSLCQKTSKKTKKNS